MFFAAAIEVPPQDPIMLSAAAATLPALPQPYPLHQQVGHPSHLPQPFLPTTMRILSNMCRIGLLKMQKSRFVLPKFFIVIIFKTKEKPVNVVYCNAYGLHFIFVFKIY